MALSDHLAEAPPRYPIGEVPTAFASTWTWAHLRSGAEAMNPLAYFQYRYDEKWLGGITAFLVEHGVVRFDPADVWGELAEPGAVLHGELYQAYLAPAAKGEQR